MLTFLEAVRSGGLLQSQTRRAMFTVQARTQGQAEGPGWEFGYGGAVLVEHLTDDVELPHRSEGPVSRRPLLHVIKLGPPPDHRL
jgi:hypothetical protein